MKKKLIVVICFAVAVVVMSVVYAVATPYLAADVSETVSKPTHDEDGDLLGTSSRPFMYPNIARADVQDITVTNQYGTYKAYRDGTNFYFEGAEELAYDKEMFSSLVVNATYTLATRKIKFDEYNYEEFGLTDETLTATIEVNTLDGKYHKIIIGNKLANGGGYYAKYDGKEYIYVLDTTLEDAVLKKLENYLTAWLVYPITVTDYVNINKFYYYRDGSPFFAARNATEEETSKGEDPYVVLYPTDKKYVASSYYYGTVLQTLTQLQGEIVLEHGLYPAVEPKLEERGETETYEEYNARVDKYNTDKAAYDEANAKYKAKLAEYGIGLEGKGHTILYTYNHPVTDSEGNKTGESVPIDFYLDISQKTDRDTYYVYSMYFGIIAEVPYSTFYWLEWELSRFLDYPMFTMNINEVNKITAEFDGSTYEFEIFTNEEGKAYKVLAGGKDYDMDAFRQFYITLLEFKIYGSTTMPEYDVPYLRIKVETDSGDYDYVLYMKTTRKVFFTLNGTGQYYVNVDKAVQFKREAIAIYNGEIVE